MKVTIITPSFNSVKTIARTIESIKKQTYPNIEHIVIDACSSDGTLELLNKMGVRYVSEPDSGIYHAMNKGIRIASGDIIHILNSDDWYSANDIVSNVVDLMESGDYDVCHAYVSLVNTCGNEVWRVGSDVKKDDLFNKMQVAHPSCFIRSSVYQRFGDFSCSFKIAADYDFILRIWSKINVIFLPRQVVQMRMEGISNSHPVRSYKESMAVAIIHGKGLWKALFTFYYQCIKHYLILLARSNGYTNTKTQHENTY